MSEFNSENFKEWLIQNNVTITQLSNGIGMSKDMLRKYRNGTNAIPARFKFTLDGFLLGRIKKDKESLK